jgi:cytoskeleton protein RodZ
MAPIRQKTTAVKAKEVPVNIPGAIPGIHVGEVLRQAREARGQSIDMVADELMIRRFYLEAIEKGSFKDLPERVYATGFVRNFATYLNLDPTPLIEQFRREAYGSRNTNYQVDLVMPEPIVHSVIPGRTAVVTAFAVLAIIVAGLIFVTRGHNAVPVTIPEPPAITDMATPAPAAVVPSAAATAVPAPVPAAPVANNDTTEQNPEFISSAPSTSAETAPAAAAPATANSNVSAALPPATSSAALPNVTAPTTAGATTPGTTTTAPAKGIVVEALKSSWVEVKNAKGTILFTSILKAGQLLPLPEENVTLTTGNAGGLRLVVDGVPQSALGQDNEVKRNIPLNPAKLHNS